MSEWDRRGNNFDLMRLSLAVLVIYSHAFVLGSGTDAREPLVRYSGGQATLGGMAVDSFFVMSGFLITASALRSPGVWNYLKKRVARIYPAFAVAAVLSAAVVLPLSGGHFADQGTLKQVESFLVQSLRLREFDYDGAFAGNVYPLIINGSTWSVQYEFWCYLGVALLMVTKMLRWRVALLWLFVASWVVSFLFVWRGWILGGKQLGLLLGPPQIWARMLPFYLAGMVFYLFRDRIPLRVWMAAVAAAVLGVGTALPFGWTLTFPIAGTYLLFWFAFTPWIKLHRFGRFGDFSYGTYLYAFPIEQLVMQRIGHATGEWVLFAVGTPLTLVAAVGSWYGVERWFLAPARRKETVAHALEASAS